MTIGFDVSWMSAESGHGGIFQYSFRLIAAMVEHTDIKVVAIIGPQGHGIFDCFDGHANFRLAMLSHRYLFADIIRTENIDVIHTPMQYHHNFTLAVPMITSLHDLQPFHYPEFFSEEEIQFRNIIYKKAAEFSTIVIVSYQHVKDDIIKFYNINPDKIVVCPLGMPIPEHIDQGNFAFIKAKYSLPEKYLLYPANVWPHKNHIKLLKALRLAYDKYGIEIPLVCTGNNSIDYFSEIMRLVNELNLNNSVIFVGYIPEGDLHILLVNSELVVIPTLYEAGSYPLMEAMAYGVPVICSNVTSLPSTIDDVRFTFDPTDENQIADKISIMLKDEVMIAENKGNSSRVVANNKWETSIKTFLYAYISAENRFKANRELSSYHNWLLNYEFFVNRIQMEMSYHTEESQKNDDPGVLIAQTQEPPLVSVEMTEFSSACKTSEIGDRIVSYEREIMLRDNYLNDIMSSTSWRITAPFRHIKELFLKLRKSFK
jgi:glycosyltransferase involved in cell wall biosynthesis